MSAALSCRLIGRWRIVEADLWDRGHLDLVEPARITIGADGHGEIAFGAQQAGLDLGYSQDLVHFTWAGFDEMDEVAGDGHAELLDDGTIEITFAYHNGDEAVLKAKRETSSTACYVVLIVTGLMMVLPTAIFLGGGIWLWRFETTAILTFLHLWSAFAAAAGLLLHLALRHWKPVLPAVSRGIS